MLDNTIPCMLFASVRQHYTRYVIGFMLDNTIPGMLLAAC